VKLKFRKRSILEFGSWTIP